MRLHSLVFLGAALFSSAAVAFSQQRPVKDQKKDFDYNELGKVPEKHREKPNPLAHDPEAATAGRLLFEEHCGECHGDDAEGTKRAPSLRAPEVQNATPGAIFWILSNGVVRKRMPVWSKLPEPQRWQLVSFLKSLGIAPAGPSSAQSNKP